MMAPSGKVALSAQTPRYDLYNKGLIELNGEKVMNKTLPK